MGKWPGVDSDGRGKPLTRASIMKRSVLIVEDEEDIRELLSYTLIREGYQVAAVASARKRWRWPRPKCPIWSCWT